jgi:hypothetical protein
MLAGEADQLVGDRIGRAGSRSLSHRVAHSPESLGIGEE